MSRALFVFCFLACLALPQFVAAQAIDSFTISQRYGDDIEPPTTPDPFLVIPISQTQIDISWGTSTDNVAVIAYQLFRDGVQIATTTAVSYSDTGLAASTTYSYYVQSLDIFQNVSIPSVTLATTTYAYPVEIEEKNNIQATVLPPRLVSLKLDAGVYSAWIQFQTQQPVTYTFRYGVNGSLGTGFVQSDVFKVVHESILTELSPDTRYQYELYATDRFGRTRLLDAGSFTTLTEYSMHVVPNVTAFDAYVLGSDVSLSWVNPDIVEFRYVRIVRNHYRYPLSPIDGYVIYEGPAASFYDTGALVGYETQYYTIFAYGVDGRFSSGAVARAQQVTDGGVYEPYIPDSAVTISTSSTSETASVWDISINDLVVVQNGTLVPLQSGVYTVLSEIPFTLRLNAKKNVPAGYGVYAHFAYPLPAMRQVQYLFQAAADSDVVLETTAQFREQGQFDVTIKVMDGTGVIRNTLPVTVVIVKESVEGVTQFLSENFYRVTLLYVLVGGVIGLLIILFLRRLFLLFFGLFDREEEEEQQK